MLRRSPFILLIAPTLALLASVARWVVQGSGNRFTTIHQRFYVPDPDLGFRVSKLTAMWLGLEIIGAMAGAVVGLFLLIVLIRRRERRLHTMKLGLRSVLFVLGLFPLAIPIAAFASGLGPIGGTIALPKGATAAPPTTGIEGSLHAAAGTYHVIKHPGSSITVKVSAGGDTFDAIFAGDVTGTLQFDPNDFAKDINADISVDAASINTGIELRNKHAREEYLHVDKYPRISLKITKRIASRQDGPDVVSFRAAATLGFMGRDLDVEVTGQVRVPDTAGLARLGLGGKNILVVQADTALTIANTALATDASTFDAPIMPIHVSLVLEHTN